MKVSVVFPLAIIVFILAAEAQADPIPDFGKDMQKSRPDDPDNTKSQAKNQKHHYKTMKMKRDEMARRMAGSGARRSAEKPAAY